MTTQRLRLEGYVRVSQVRGRRGDSFISPGVQADRMRAWCAAHGHELTDLQEELDASGARADRPKLLAAVARVEAGESDGIIVARLDRFGRSLIDGLRLIERIQEAGGTFVSVSDGFDLSTDTGRLVLRIMLSLAEFELERIRSAWNDARSRAVERGIHLAPIVPFGYQRRDDGGLEPHPRWGPVAGELIRRRADGEGWKELAAWLEQLGATTGYGRTIWSLRGMRDIVRSEVYVGVASHGDYRLDGAHEAVVDRATWERAQRPGVKARSRSDTPALLGGLLRCGGCRYTMGSHLQDRADGSVARYHHCRTRSERNGARCDEAAHARADAIEAIVLDRYWRQLPVLRARARATNPQLAQLERDREQAARIRDEWRDDTRAQQAGLDVYMAGLTTRQAAVDAIDQRIRDLHERAGALALPEVDDLRARWHQLAVTDQRELLAAAIHCIFLRRASGDLPLEQRVRVIWHGEHVDVPRPGRRNYIARPFDFDAPVHIGTVPLQDP